MNTPSTFTITLRPSEKSFSCQAGKHILAAGAANGISLRFSCRSGVCRTCRARLIAGEVDYGSVNSNYLSEEDKAAGYVHLCCASPLSDCVFEASEYDLESPAAQYPVRVMKLNKLAADVMQIVVGFPPNEPLHYSAGQYLDVLLAGDVKRSYSIATAPIAEGLRQVELHVRHMAGGLFTDRVFETLKVKDLLRIEAPQGFFKLDEASDKPIIFIASGTGFAPIKAMVEYCLQKGIKRSMRLYWGGRKREDLYMSQLAASWASEHTHIKYIPVLSAATERCDWQGRVGLVHQAVLDDFSDLSKLQVYACGVPVMVDAARTDFTNLRGLPNDQFFADSFVSEADKARSLAAA
jgi:CDP-4-dehydro-6-deoxyglucose reductase, E3